MSAGSRPVAMAGNRSGVRAVSPGKMAEEGVLDHSASGPQPSGANDPATIAPLALDRDDRSSSEPGIIEPGRALALVDFSPPSVSTGERLIRLAYRVGIPGSMLSAPMGKKSRTRLLATVNNTLPGNRTAGTAIRAGHFLVHGSRTPVAQVDYSGAARLTPPLEKLVHSFAWLSDLEACAPREQGAPVAERILLAWLQANPKLPSRPGKGPAWSLGNAGMRLMAWLVHAPLVLAGEKSVRTRTLAHINDTARWLDRHVGRAEDRLAEVAGWCGIIAAGLLLAEGRPRRLYGEAGLLRALGELVGDDGGVLSRSPLAQMEAIALLVRLRNCYQATRRDPPPACERVVELLLPPLLALVHGDGGLGSWQGGWAVEATELDALVKASGVRTRPLRDVRQWGYQRVVAHKSILQFDAAPPPMPAQARCGCASTLAFELSHGVHRLVVNCGGAAAAGGIVPIRLEQGLRATAAHSTLTLDDANSTAILLNGGIGSGVNEVAVDRKTLPQDNGRVATRLEGNHNGYVSRYGLTHQRILILRDDGSELRGEDLLVPAGRKGKRGKVSFAIRFHLGPDVDVSLTADGQGAGLALPDGSFWQFRSGTNGEGSEVTVEDSLWVDGQGRPQATQQIVIQGLLSRGGGNFGWVLKKMN
ncbi:heparinase II/III-like protein [Novosphingobium sp. Rr 2-17]|uniref:heparinase II/III family protein n=1 Tax=Novosphingobium sp. Rr 2-17 TaxID=555793 RepID=UPI000269A1EB|nr:heparinase II/III family protein [Novosphingobium sp. Rr 2-17]EIZ79159.1 heparinase II/III-like protein [Novosphingobium sp. Rr 2-17]